MHDISDMAMFVEVVRQGGFSAAGRRLGMATSVVSDRVKGLEQRLGVKLLNRTTRSQVLTESGTTYLARASQIVDEIADLEASVMARSSIPRGDLRITAPGPLGRQHVAPLVGQFCLDHPLIRAHLTVDDRFSDIAAEGFDIAFRGGPAVDSQFTGRCLFTTRRVVVASPAYLREQGSPKTPEDLKNHRCLVFNSQAHFSAEWRLGRGKQMRTLRMDGAMASTNSELPITWALAGLGLTQKSWWEVAPHIASGLLETVLDSYEPEPASFYAIHPVRSAQSRKIGLFVDAAAAYFERFGEA
jgi:DNA-binding transcriptional LysR family regulator